MTRALAGVVALAAGCVKQSATAAPDLARASSQPIVVEVALSGTVTRPADTKGDATVWIVDAPCWQTGARAFGSARTATGDAFALQVYVPQGTQLWVCAAVGDATKPLEIYGQADRAPQLGRSTGAVAITGLSVPLAEGKPVTAPRTR